ncbi:MAG: hypothetical protein WB561_04045 [Terracidiphilus sp.]
MPRSVEEFVVRIIHNLATRIDSREDDSGRVMDVREINHHEGEPGEDEDAQADSK